MSAAPILWLCITAGGAARALVWLAFNTQAPRISDHQRLSDAATREQYRAEERARPDRDAADGPARGQHLSHKGTPPQRQARACVVTT